MVASTCDTCKCQLSNLEIINDLINAATVTANVEKLSATLRMNAILDEDLKHHVTITGFHQVL